MFQNTKEFLATDDTLRKSEANRLAGRKGEWVKDQAVLEVAKSQMQSWKDAVA